jgi:hypothetical protein
MRTIRPRHGILICVCFAIDMPRPDAAVSAHPLLLAGVLLLVVGLLLYVGSIMAAILRVGSQFSRAMPGKAGLRINAALTAAIRRWYFLALVAVGAVLISLGR